MDVDHTRVSVGVKKEGRKARVERVVISTTVSAHTNLIETEINRHLLLIQIPWYWGQISYQLRITELMRVRLASSSRFVGWGDR